MGIYKRFFATKSVLLSYDVPLNRICNYNDSIMVDRSINILVAPVCDPEKKRKAHPRPKDSGSTQIQYNSFHLIITRLYSCILPRFGIKQGKPQKHQSQVLRTGMGQR